MQNVLEVRCTDKHVKPVGETRKGFATGYIWECIDVADCEIAIVKKLKAHQEGTLIHEKIKASISIGRWR